MFSLRITSLDHNIMIRLYRKQNTQQKTREKKRILGFNQEPWDPPGISRIRRTRVLHGCTFFYNRSRLVAPGTRPGLYFHIVQGGKRYYSREITL
jgi:hypothetical protein